MSTSLVCPLLPVAQSTETSTTKSVFLWYRFQRDAHLCFAVFVCLLVVCLTSQQHASVSQGRICSDNFTCCHTEIEVADPTFYLTQAQYTDTGPTSPSADPISPGAWQGSHWSAIFLSHWYDSTPKKSRRKRDSNPGSSALEAVFCSERMAFTLTKYLEKSFSCDREFPFTVNIELRPNASSSSVFFCFFFLMLQQSTM